jgi:quercetin dioxygenase-like cupin family protein
MQILRIYTGADNQTHFQDVSLDAFTAIATNPGTGPIRLTPRAGEAVADFHNAPRRQYVVMLSGTMEIETGLGEKRVLHPGDVLIAEDVTGKGHITRSVGGDMRVTLAVPLAGA